MSDHRAVLGKPQWYEDLPEESFLAVLRNLQDDNGRYDYRAVEHPMDGLGEFFHWVLAGISIAVFVLSTTIFALMDAEWSLWHWIVLGVFGGIPTLLTVAGLVAVAVNHVTQYRRYKEMLAYAETKGWRP